jgi:hypothetical protein
LKFERTHGEHAHGAGAHADEKDIEVIVDPSGLPTKDGGGAGDGGEDDDYGAGPGDYLDPEGQEEDVPDHDDDADDEDPPRKSKKGGKDDGEDYSRRVQKRIDKEIWRRSQIEAERDDLRRQLEEVRRAQREAQREREEAEAHAVAVREEQLKAERKRLQKDLKEALETGNAEAIYDANEAIARVVTETQRIEYLKSQISSRKPQADEDDGEGATPGSGKTQQQQMPPRKPHPKALKWASENEGWFQKDDAMTGAAYAIDRKLQAEGYDPTGDEYYAELNRRIRAAFPHKFKRNGAARGGTVAPVGNRGGKDRPGERVRLTQSELDIARRLGLPPKVYAKYKDYE